MCAGKPVCYKQINSPDFHGINIPTTADFKLSAVQQLAHKILEYLTMGFCELVQTAYSTPISGNLEISAKIFSKIRISFDSEILRYFPMVLFTYIGKDIVQKCL